MLQTLNTETLLLHNSQASMKTSVRSVMVLLDV